MAHWRNSSKTPETAKIADPGFPGDPGYEGDRYPDDHEEKDKRGRLIIDELTGLPKNWKPKRDSRGSWPPDCYIRIKANVTGTDYDVIEEARRDILEVLQNAGQDKAASNKTVQTKWMPAIYAAQFIRSFHCKIGKPEDGCSNAFEDPDTCKVGKDEDGTPMPIEGTGKLMVMPVDADFSERLAYVKDLDMRVLQFVMEEVQKRNNDPLVAPTTTPSSKTD